MARACQKSSRKCSAQNTKTRRKPAEMAPTPTPTAEQLAYRKVCLYLQICLGSTLIKVVEAPSRHRNRPEPSLHRLSRTLAWRKSRMGPRILQKCMCTLSSIKFNILEMLPQNAHTNNYVELQCPVSHPQSARCFILSHRHRYLGRKRFPPHTPRRDPHPRNRRRLHLPKHLHHPRRSPCPPSRPHPTVRLTRRSPLAKMVQETHGRRRRLRHPKRLQHHHHEA